MSGATQRNNKTGGQMLALIRYASAHGGIMPHEIRTILCIGDAVTVKTLRGLAERNRIQVRPDGRWVAVPPPVGHQATPNAHLGARP